VRDGFERFGLLDGQVRFLQGPSSRTLRKADIGPIALLRVGAATDDPTAVLDALYDQVSPGGHVLVAGAHADAAEAFRAVRGITEPLVELAGGAVAWQRAGANPYSSASRAPEEADAATTATDELDLTVVVVVYNMRREAERTLRSLSRTYQEGIADLRYEV